MKIIDAHSHIDYITHNFQKDVVGTVCCTTNESEWPLLVNKIQNDDKIYGCFGVHPWFANEVQKNFDERLKSLLQTDSHYMIGEIGLDKYKPNMTHQIDVFLKQFVLAMILKRIVFLHCVGAWDKILHIFKQYKISDLPIIVVHDFNGNKDILVKLLRYKNLFFSFGKNIVYDRNSCIEQIQSNRILVESDGQKGVILKDVVTTMMNIKKDVNVPDIVYNNTQRILNNEQVE